MNLGIAELWSLHMDDARRDLEEALAVARRIGRPYLEIGCLGHLALAAVLSGSPMPDALRLSEEAVTIAKAHGWGTHRILAPAVAARRGHADLARPLRRGPRMAGPGRASATAGRGARDRSPSCTTPAGSCGSDRAGTRRR